MELWYIFWNANIRNGLLEIISSFIVPTKIISDSGDSLASKSMLFGNFKYSLIKTTWKYAAVLCQIICCMKQCTFIMKELKNYVLKAQFDQECSISLSYCWLLTTISGFPIFQFLCFLLRVLQKYVLPTENIKTSKVKLWKTTYTTVATVKYKAKFTWYSLSTQWRHSTTGRSA